MTNGICFAGLDVHARKTAGAAVQLGSGEVFKAQIPGPPVEAIGWLVSLPGPVRAVYEAGPTGFGLARAARAAGLEVMVCSPGAIPRQPGDRVKTDTRDALKLARLHAAGQLRPVLVPTLELEALRDLVRAREDLRGDLMAARHRIGKLLLRRGLIFPGPGDPWASQRHLAWLGSVRLPDELAQIVLGEYLACHEVLLARRERLDDLIAEHAQGGPWAPLVGRLRCMRGIDTLTAAGLVAEIGDFGAFSHPKQLASFVGLVPSERSSGDKRRQGTITKAGSSHARRLLIEAAWHYRRQPAVSVTLRRRQAGQPAAAIQTAWRAQLRLSRRWAHLDARRAKRRTTVAVAVARELTCFIWEIARQPD
ncbi:MAG: IS110 family transposase [Actinobacteria bacterium]|nr:IS110 family transposase [Actinomycetota bacterium]